MLGNSGGDPESGSSGGDGIAMAEADRSSGGGNRWPRQETMALIKIRTDMDVAFRDSSLKGPLWDEVSRKLSELGYHRNAKKCKEKFENVFKYHKRTKDGRATKSEGKTYRFFDQLEALDSQPPPHHPTTHQAATQATPLSIAMPANNHTQAATQASPISIAMPSIPNNPTSVAPSPFNISFSAPTNRNPTPVASSSSGSSDEEQPEMRTKDRKRKWEDFFERLAGEVMQRQEDMQKKFLEALEKREKDRVAREEAWRAQELARTNREREILAQERAVSNAKDTMIFAFLQKVSETPLTPSDQQTVKPNETVQQNNTVPPQPPLPLPPSEPVPPPPPPPPIVPQKQVPQPPVSAPVPPPPPPAQLQLQIQPPVQVQAMTKPITDNGGEIVNFSPNPSPSRWPKGEIEALIKLRTNLDLKYQENVPKGPLWEEISAGMLRMGYNRNPKRCKEKWENINKYYKKMKESNKKRPEDSKTCPYFSQLEAIYKARETHFKQESMAAPIMARPEQQWPVQNRPELPLMEDHESDDDMDDDEDEENEGGNYEFVAAKPSSAVGTAE